MEVGDTKAATFGRYFRSLRTKAGLSQARLAEAAAVSLRTIVYWESDERLPRLPELESALTALGATQAERGAATLRMMAPRALRQTQELASKVAPPQIGPVPRAGDILKMLRRRRGLSSSTVAAALGINPATLHRWERTESLPSDEQLTLLCTTLDAHPEESAALLSSLGKPPPPSSGLSLLHHQVEQFVLDCDVCRTPLIDMEALTLRRALWPLATHSAEAQRLLALMSTHYGDWLSFQGRRDEAWRAAGAALEIAAPFGRPDRFWLTALDIQTSIQADKPRHGTESALRIYEKWADTFSRPEHQAYLRSCMAEYTMRAGRYDEALALIDQVDHLAQGLDGSDDGVRASTERARHMQRARVYARIGRTTEALDLLAAFSSENPVTRAYDLYLWSETLLAAGERSEAVGFLDQCQQTIDTHGLRAMQPRLDAISQLL